MKAKKHNQMATDLQNGSTDRETTRRRAYLRPDLTTYDAETIIREIGPAHGVYGPAPGNNESL